MYVCIGCTASFVNFSEDTEKLTLESVSWFEQQQLNAVHNFRDISQIVLIIRYFDL